VAAQLPASLPTFITNHCIYLGKLVITTSSNTGTFYPETTKTVGQTPVQNHNDLANIQDAPNAVVNEHYHLSNVQATLVDNIRTNNLTDDPSPIDADNVPIWDSGASALKKVTFANIKAFFTNTLTVSAGNVLVTPAGGITSTDGQAAFQELDTKKATKASPTFWDSVDNLKKIIFNISGVTSGQTRTVTFPDRDINIGNTATGTLEFCISGNGGIIQVSQYGGYVQIPYSCTITGWSISEGSPTPVSSTATMDIYKKSSFYPQAADTIFPSTKPNLTAQVNNSATGLNISVSAGDWITFAVTANNNAAILNLVLTVIKT
jgi:hypothetical protein